MSEYHTLEISSGGDHFTASTETAIGGFDRDGFQIWVSYLHRLRVCGGYRVDSSDNLRGPTCGGDFNCI